MASVLRTMESVYVAVVVCWGELASETRNVKVLLPVAVGVPLMTPVEERDNPAGSEPETGVVLHVIGVVPPVVWRVVVYAS